MSTSYYLRLRATIRAKSALYNVSVRCEVRATSATHRRLPRTALPAGPIDRNHPSRRCFFLFQAFIGKLITLSTFLRNNQGKICPVEPSACLAFSQPPQPPTGACERALYPTARSSSSIHHLHPLSLAPPRSLPLALVAALRLSVSSPPQASRPCRRLKPLARRRFALAGSQTGARVASSRGVGAARPIRWAGPAVQ